MKIHHGDCRETLKCMEPGSVDSLVTDPRAGISFMGKDWDSDKGGRDAWIVWMKEVMQECLRVLKPGAHALVWAIPRTSHWTATALEDAGFEIRDIITHLFGSGFPKSLDISKAIDKATGAERNVVGVAGSSGSKRECMAGDFKGGEYFSTAPSTPDAKQWQGWGTALKPASEHWILARKPLAEKTVAANVLKHGTGGINIDASRIRGVDQEKFAKNWDREKQKNLSGIGIAAGEGVNSGIENTYLAPQGRFPANLVLSHSDHCTFVDQTDRGFHDQGIQVIKSEWACAEGCAVAELDSQSGTLKAGGASRFFYVAKASKSERNAGCEGLPEKKNDFQRESSGLSTTTIDGVRQKGNCGQPKANHHPTVKPLKLMRYLIRLITPPGGIVLDPFTGSGSTGVAAIQEGFHFVGIELNPEYIAIAQARFNHRMEAVAHG